MAKLIRRFRYDDQKQLKQMLDELIRVIGAGQVFLGAIEDCEFFINVSEDDKLNFALVKLKDQPTSADQLKTEYQVMTMTSIRLANMEEKAEA